MPVGEDGNHCVESPRLFQHVRNLEPHHTNGRQVNGKTNGVSSSASPNIGRATAPDAPTQDIHELQSRLERQYANIIGNSRIMLDITQKAMTVARTDASILLQGETGTGKELIARRIHAWSGRDKGSFVPINCVALPEERLENELFGHEKGAFTDAKTMKPGLLEVAHGGTLFLDEIGEMKPHLQTRILRLLEDQRFFRIGGTKMVTTNIRIIAATNRDLAYAIPNGEFRKDLFYRFSLMLTLPPLRARPDDIPSLAHFFLQNICHEWRRPILQFSPDALDTLQKQPWHGNVRELRSAVEQCVMFKTGNTVIEADEIPMYLMAAQHPSGRNSETAHQGPYHTVVRDFRRKVIREALERAHGNTTVAANFLHLQRTYLGRLIKQLGIPINHRQGRTQ